MAMVGLVRLESRFVLVFDIRSGYGLNCRWLCFDSPHSVPFKPRTQALNL